MGALLLVVAGAGVAAAVSLAAQSPRQLRASMFAAARAQHSVHYAQVGAARGLRQVIVGDVAGHRGIQRITVAIGRKTGRFTVTVLKRVAYLRGDTFSLHVYLGFTAAQAARYHGRWISVPPGSARYNALAAAVTLPSFLHDIYPIAPLLLVTTKIGGRNVTGVRGTNRQPGETLKETLYPDTKGRPFAVADVDVVHGVVAETKISRWNETVRVPAPTGAVPISTVRSS